MPLREHPAPFKKRKMVPKVSELNKLFVYGTLKSSHNGPMSKKLGSVSTDRKSVV